MPQKVLDSRDVMQVARFLNENSKELRARSDAKSVTFGEAKMATKLKYLNVETDKILTPLLEHYLAFKVGEERIQLDTLKKLRAAIKEVHMKEDQSKVIQKLLRDL